MPEEIQAPATTESQTANPVDPETKLGEILSRKLAELDERVSTAEQTLLETMQTVEGFKQYASDAGKVAAEAAMEAYGKAVEGKGIEPTGGNIPPLLGRMTGAQYREYLRATRAARKHAEAV